MDNSREITAFSLVEFTSPRKLLKKLLSNQTQLFPFFIQQKIVAFIGANNLGWTSEITL